MNKSISVCLTNRAPSKTHLSTRLLMQVCAVAALVTVGTDAQASPLLYSSADFGGPELNGASVLSGQWYGVRFQLTKPSVITDIGANIEAIPGYGDGRYFGAIVRLTSMSDYPDSISLTTPDVLGVTTFAPGSPSSDVKAPIGPLTVGSGTYALLIGTGLFGTSGIGHMPIDNPNPIPASFFALQGSQWLDIFPGDNINFRMTVYGVPEPAVLQILAPMVLVVFFRSLRTRNARRQSSIGR
jgi:hypothetical protein